MKTMSLQAPSDVRRSREKAKLYIATHEQLEREVRGKFDRECVLELDIVLSLTDFSEVNHGAA
ncbi:hypothetical protein [Ochrobactrum sp. S1502_03]|uniref:hypothetical protein n=1 Tax=Ochrobactrum sp. S1502_03 TaxID=3108451 RepID=UPI0037CB44A4